MKKLEIFPWSEKFSTSLPLIDEQHQNLVKLINELAFHQAHAADQATLSDAFKRLADYAVYHFESEEAIWHEFMPGENEEASHKEGHDSFISQVSQIQLEQVGKSNDDVMDEVLRFLIRWLVCHILGDDMKMAKLVHSLKAGMTLQEAKYEAKNDTSIRTLLTDSILDMYSSLSATTMALVRESVSRKKVEERLYLASVMVENTPEAMCIIDADCKIIDANKAFSKRANLLQEQLIGKNLQEFNFCTDVVKVRASLATDMTTDKWSGLVSSHDANDQLIIEWCSLSSSANINSGDVVFIIVFSNITTLINQHKEVEYLAYHDYLTHLPNRTSLMERIKVVIPQAVRNKKSAAICFLDLDGFKQVNDLFGHDAGDEVLIEISRRLKDIVREEDTVSRIGGDEFILLLAQLECIDNCREILDRVVRDIQQPIQINNGASNVTVTASIGVTTIPEDKGSIDEMISHADAAMYQAKNSGKSTYKFYDSL